MGKVTFKTTTSNNDVFQKVVADMLRDIHSSTNHSLDIMQTDDDKIVIQPMGSWNYHINFNANPKGEKEREVYHLFNNYAGEHYYVSLTADQVNLLKWMGDIGVMCVDDWEWEKMEDMEIKVI